MIARQSRSLAAIAALGLAAAGCGSTREVTFRVTSGPGVHDEPLAAAHVRVVALDRGPVPLPLNDETLREILAGEPATGAATGRDGRARLELPAGVPHLVEVMPPPFGWKGADSEAARGTVPTRGVWILNADGATLTPCPIESMGVPLGLRVEP